MRIAIHQPEFLPWPGFFHKMAAADQYVILDHVQFKKRYFENRNRIVKPNGQLEYIGVPVLTKGRFTQAINQVELDNGQPWQRRILRKLHHYYGKAPCFSQYFPVLEELILERKHHRLVDLNIALIDFFREHLKISTPLVRSSGLSISSHSGSDLILHICRSQKAKTYICGSLGQGYLNLADFSDNSIQIEWQEYAAPCYQNGTQSFQAGASTLDILFNHGPQTVEIVMSGDKKYQVEENSR